MNKIIKIIKEDAISQILLVIFIGALSLFITCICSSIF